MTNDEIMRELEKLQREVEILKGSNLASMGAQSVMSGDIQMLGQTTIRIPIIYALSTGANPTDADANGVFMNAFGETWDDGTNLWQLGGVNNGSLQFGLKSTDGAAYFSGGQGTIDSNGINLNGIMYAIRHYAEDPTAAIQRYGRFEMLYPDGKTIPALALTFQDATTTSELITNGGFEDGDFTWWTTSGSLSVGTWFAPSYYSHGGTYFAGCYPSSSITSSSISCSPGIYYSFSAWVKRGGSCTCKIEAKWYDSGSSIIRTDTIYNSTPSASWMNVTSSLLSPTGTDHCVIVATISGADICFLDDISFQSVSLVRRLLFTPDLEYMDGSTYRKVLSGKKELYAPLAPVIALVATASGNCTNGAHLCKVTFVDADGETEASAASNSVTVDGTHKQITCTLEVGPWGTTSRNIYMTEAGGTVYKLVGTQADNTTASYTIDVADGSLTTVAPVVNLSGSRPLFPRSNIVFYPTVQTSVTWTHGSTTTQQFGFMNQSVASVTVGDVYNFNMYLAEGTYTFELFGVKTDDSGIFKCYVDNALIDTYDLYQAVANYNVNLATTGISVVGNGYHKIRFVCSSKNGSSSDYRFLFTYIAARSTTDVY